MWRTMSAWTNRLALLGGSLVTAASLAIAGTGDAVPPMSGALIQVTTTPPGAVISCDGTLRDAAPLTLSDLPSGPHLIVATKQGHREARQTVMAKVGERVAVDLALEPIMGLLLVHSTPPEADVQVNGAFRGKTPLLVTDLPLGRYRIRVARDGYGSREVDCVVRDRIPEKVDVPLVSTAARLVITSTPEGAQVSVDGISRGVTPCTLENVAAGDHLLEFSTNGYESVRQNVRVDAGRTENLTIVMRATPSELSIVSLPAGARIYIDNQFRGEAPVTVKDIEPGTYRVRAELKGHDSVARDIPVALAKKVIEEFRLISNSGDFEITTDPPGVKVVIDDKDAGVTAPKSDASEVVSKPFLVQFLSPGTHRVALSCKGYESKQFDIEVKEGKTVAGHHALVRLFTPDYEVRTSTGVYRGILKDRDGQGNIRLELSPGVIKVFRANDIRFSAPVPVKPPG